MHRHAIFPMLAAAMIGLHAEPVEAQSPVTPFSFVSVSGTDGSIDCSFGMPCRSLQVAHGKTLPGGTIRCLDSASFFGVTITKSITIDCAGTAATTDGLGTSQIAVNGANIVVNVRNITIMPAANNTGPIYGVQFTQGAMLNLDNVKIHGFASSAAAGILFAPNTGN